MKFIIALFMLAIIGVPSATAALRPGCYSVPGDVDKMFRSPGTNADDLLLQKGKVVSAIDANQYTYIEVEQESTIFWLAAPSVFVKKNDIIRFENGLVMTNFFITPLKRMFQSITFVKEAVVSNE